MPKKEKRRKTVLTYIVIRKSRKIIKKTIFKKESFLIIFRFHLLHTFPFKVPKLVRVRNSNFIYYAIGPK
jgi:hypothetical protein